MICPNKNCGFETEVVKTIPLKSQRTRLRECPNCKWQFWTVESIIQGTILELDSEIVESLFPEHKVQIIPKKNKTN